MNKPRQFFVLCTFPTRKFILGNDFTTHTFPQDSMSIPDKCLMTLRDCSDVERKFREANDHLPAGWPKTSISQVKFFTISEE